MNEGFDVGLEMSGNPAAFRDMLANMCHGGKIAMLGIPAERDRHRLEHGHLQHAHHQGHLRPRDVRNLVQDDRHAPERPRHRARSSPTASTTPSSSRASRSCARGELRQSRSSTGRSEPAAMYRHAMTTHAFQRPRSAESSTRSATAGLYKARTRHHHARSGRTIGVVERPRRCSTSAPTTTSAWPTIPRSIAAAHEALDRWGYGLASRPLHLRHAADPQAARSDAQRVPRHRGHDPLFLLLRRQRRAVRDAARRRGRGHLRRAEPRLASSTASGSARRSASATATTTWPTCEAKLKEAAPPAPLPADRHRRRLLDGRHHRQPAERSAIWPTSTTRW